MPAPSFVLLSFVVGLELILQQTPLAKTGAPPSSVTLPPVDIAVAPTLVTSFVLTTGDFNIGSVSHLMEEISIRKRIPIVQNL